MVYVFFVQPGKMMTFDNEISVMQSVGLLKDKIEEKWNIPKDHQVLLINGGESLDPNKNLCSYMAGTDSNPIYLFGVNYDASNLDILKDLNYDDGDIQKRLTDCLNLPVSLSTVKTRAAVAQDFYIVAKSQLDFGEKMIHEQHLQQQGWSAVIANLEDMVVDFRKRKDLFFKISEEFIAGYPEYETFLSQFKNDKEILQRIPIIDTLLENLSENKEMDSSKISETTNSTSETEPPGKDISLYEWISPSDRKNTLEELFVLCKTNLSNFEKEVVPSLKKKIDDILELAETPKGKEIEGLGKRLSDLEELLRRLKKNVAHQSDMAQSFQQNQNSVANIKDTSILPDLCATHKQQMELIKSCHQKLMEDRNRIVKAKHELGKSLCSRIGWVQNVEGRIYDLDLSLVFLHGHLQRLKKHLEVFQQLHLAPITYMNAVVEVVRRRSFSQLFLMWASNLACQQLTIHNEEMTRRKEFSSLFEGHFLETLFPGMSDVPPAFAIEAPPMFDAKLPTISRDDVEKLKKELPDFAESLVVPDMTHVENFFTGKRKDDKVDNAKGVEDKLIQAVSDVGLASNLDKNLLKATGSEPCLVSAPGLPTDKGCESETDTEEFEKVGQSPLELTFPQGVATGAVPKQTDKQDASTITEVRNQVLPPKKPPRSFRATPSSLESDPMQRTLSISTNESFTNIKNISLDSIDELSSIKNFTSTTDSCFNSHYNQYSAGKEPVNLLLTSTSSSSLHLSDVGSLSKANATSHNQGSSLMLSRSKSVSPQSPRDAQSFQDCNLQSDFSTDEFYIDESLPSSVGTGNSQGSEFVRQLDNANIVVAMLQDNLQISRTEHDKLKEMFLSLSALAKMATSAMRTDLDEFKTHFANDSQYLRNQYEELGQTWNSLVVEVDKNEREIVEVMLREHEEEKERFRYNLLEKEDIVRRLEEDKRAVEDRIANTCRQLAALEENLAKQNAESSKNIEDLLKQLHEKELDKDKCLKELSENLKAEHRTEIDNIKSRLKLMTMEKSPSLSSLEKEKSGDFSSLPSHSTLLAQMTEHFQVDKENAVTEEKKKWEKVLEEKLKEQQLRFEEEKDIFSQDVAKRVSEDKEKQIDVLREREKNLNLEVIKYKTTIQQLAECQEESDWHEQLETLKEEKEAIQQELNSYKTAYLPTVSGESCRTGDVVLVVWDHVFQNFKVYLTKDSKHAYFVDSACLAKLDLIVSNGKPNKVHCVAEVVDKAFCHVMKSENRFRLPKNTKFFLVRLKRCSNNEQSSDLVQSQYTPSAIDDSTDAEPEIARIEKELAEDSGIVDVEQAEVAVEEIDSRIEEEKFWSTQWSIPKGYPQARWHKDTNEVDMLKLENELLRQELNKIKLELMSASVSVCEGKLDVSTSPLAISPPPDLTKSEIVFNRPPRLNIDSCKKGDIVLLLWDQAHGNFKVLQESRLIYFLHSDSLEKLGLTITDGKPNKQHCTGEVIDKEYCKTRKSENRYNVPKGAKFFRVKVKPVVSLHQSSESSRHVSSISTSQSAITTFDPLLEEGGSVGQDQPILETDGNEEERDQSRCATTRTDSESSRIEVLDQCAEDSAGPKSVSECELRVDDCAIEEATAATENIDRYEGESCKEVVEQSTYVSTHWLEAMFRSMFSK